MPLYQFTIELNDKLSNPMQKIATSGVATYTKLTGKQKKYNTAVDQGTRKMKAFGGGIGRLKTLVGGFIGLHLGKTILGWGADMEQTRISFQTLTGDVEKGNKLFSEINQFANVTPFNNAVLQKSANTMLAFGISLDKVMPNLGMLGDVAGGDAEKMKSLTLAFSQVQSAGKLMGQDLLQFINTGFNPLKIISEQTGKSMGQLKDEMSKGGISAGMVSDAFKIATSEGGLFFKMMEKQSATMGGKWSTLVGKIQFGLGGFIESNKAYFTSILNGLIKTVDWISENTSTLVAFFGTLAGGFAIYKTWVLWNKRVAIWQAIVAATNPITGIYIGIVALAGVVAWAWYKFDKFRAVVMGVWEVLKGFGNMMKTYVIDRFKELLSGIGSLGSAIAALFRGEFAKAGELAFKGVKGVLGVDSRIAAVKAGLDLGNKFNQGYASELMKGVEATPLPGADGGVGAKDKGKKEKQSAIDRLKNAFGNQEDPSGKLGESATVKAGISGIAGGGTRQTNVNVTLGNLIENFSINSETVTEGIDQMRDMVTEQLLRVLNSSNKMSFQQ